MPSGIRPCRCRKAGYSKRNTVKVAGHHHSIDGLVPELLEQNTAKNAAPFYLLNGAVLLKDVKKGEPVTLEHVDLSGLPTFDLYKKGTEL